MQDDLSMLSDGEKGVILQRDRETYAVAPHIPCGLVTPELLRKLADVSEKYDLSAMKITSAGRIAMLGIREEDVDSVWADLEMDPGAATGQAVRSVKSCPGNSHCKRGQQDSLGVGLDLDGKYHGRCTPGKVKMGVSGCPNQCAETNFKDIGLVGTPKGWRILVGGNGGANPRIGQVLAKDLTTESVTDMVDRILAYYHDNAKPRERIGRLIQRLGLEHMQKALGL
jgi:NAD(P)H-nitrite reductase large subunit